MRKTAARALGPLRTGQCWLILFTATELKAQAQILAERVARFSLPTVS